MEINSLAEYFPVVTDVVFFSWWRREGGREEGGRERGGNIPCNSLAISLNLPCTTSHSNASKLDTVFVVQCFIQCLLVRREEKRREEKRREEKRREEKRREEKRREEKRREEEEKRTEREEEKRRERGPTVLMSSTPPCVVSKCLRVYWQNARMCSTCGRLASELDMNTVRFFSAHQAVPHTTQQHTNTTPHQHNTTTPQHHNTTTQHNTQHNMYTQRHMYIHTRHHTKCTHTLTNTIDKQL